MTEFSSLHPFDHETVERYVRAVIGEIDGTELVAADPAWAERLIATARQGYLQAQTGRESGANIISFSLARLLATAHPTFLLPGASLTPWEARIDRGIGMLLRPPSRLFSDAGLAPAAARTMPIRLDLSAGLMGGAYIPARLISELQRLLESRAERSVRRLIDADLDGVAILGLMMEAATYAAERGLGLYEALDVITPEAPAADPPGARILVPDRKRLDRELRRRLEEAAKPPKKPGLAARLLGRGRRA